MFNDTKHYAVCLRQLSFLCMPEKIYDRLRDGNVAYLNFMTYVFCKTADILYILLIRNGFACMMSGYRITHTLTLVHFNSDFSRLLRLVGGLQRSLR